MGVYIDRDELLDLYANTDDLDISNYDVKVAVIRQNILDMPTIDIVRCGECKHRVIDQDIQSGHICLKRRNNGGLYCEDDDFCSYGERRADETQP